MLILHLSALRLHPAGEFTCRKRGMTWKGSGDDDTGLRRTLPHSQPGQLWGSQLSSKSAQVQSHIDAMALFSNTKLPLPAPWFTLFPISWRAQLCSLEYQPQEHLRMPGCSKNLSYSAGTDLGTMVRDARYYVPLSKPVFPGTDPSDSLFLIDHQPLSCS